MSNTDAINAFTYLQSCLLDEPFENANLWVDQHCLPALQVVDQEVSPAIYGLSTDGYYEAVFSTEVSLLEFGPAEFVEVMQEVSRDEQRNWLTFYQKAVENADTTEEIKTTVETYITRAAQLTFDPQVMGLLFTEVLNNPHIQPEDFHATIYLYLVIRGIAQEAQRSKDEGNIAGGSGVFHPDAEFVAQRAEELMQKGLLRAAIKQPTQTAQFARTLHFANGGRAIAFTRLPSTFAPGMPRKFVQQEKAIARQQGIVLDRAETTILTHQSEEITAAHEIYHAVLHHGLERKMYYYDAEGEAYPFGLAYGIQRFGLATMDKRAKALDRANTPTLAEMHNTHVGLFTQPSITETFEKELRVRARRINLQKEAFALGQAIMLGTMSPADASKRMARAMRNFNWLIDFADQFGPAKKLLLDQRQLGLTPQIAVMRTQQPSRKEPFSSRWCLEHQDQLEYYSDLKAEVKEYPSGIRNSQGATVYNILGCIQNAEQLGNTDVAQQLVSSLFHLFDSFDIRDTRPIDVLPVRNSIP